MWKQLRAKCPDFEKSLDACKVKYKQLLNDYRSDKAVNATSGQGRQEKCKYFKLMDMYHAERPIVSCVSHARSLSATGLISSTSLLDATVPMESSTATVLKVKEEEVDISGSNHGRKKSDANNPGVACANLGVAGSNPGDCVLNIEIGQ